MPSLFSRVHAQRFSAEEIERQKRDKLIKKCLHSLEQLELLYELPIYKKHALIPFKKNLYQWLNQQDNSIDADLKRNMYSSLSAFTNHDLKTRFNTSNRIFLSVTSFSTALSAASLTLFLATCALAASATLAVPPLGLILATALLAAAVTFTVLYLLFNLDKAEANLRLSNHRQDKSLLRFRNAYFSEEHKQAQDSPRELPAHLHRQDSPSPNA